MKARRHAAGWRRGPGAHRRDRFASLCAANAAAVAALYWNQAIVQSVAASFPNSAWLLSLMPMMTLAGYATGVAVIAFGPPAHGQFSIGRHLVLLVAALAAAGAAPDVLTLALASFFVGTGAAVAQRLLASAARLGGPGGAGSAIGTALGAALTAVLAVRLVGDTLAGALGWRTVFFLAATGVAAAGLCGALTQALDEPPATPDAASGAVRALWRANALLRRATLQQAALFAAYNAAWLTVLVEVPPHQRSLVVIGGCGAGLVAALAGGRLVDRLRRLDVPRAGAAAVLMAGSVLLPAAYAAPGLSRTLLLLAGMALLDAGLQVTLVANQARVQALLPAARSRLAATVTVCGSLGGALGAGAGYRLWQQFGWPAAIGFTAAAALLGLACSLVGAAAQPASPCAERNPPSSPMPMRAAARIA